MATSDQVEVPAPRPRLLERLRLWFEQTFVGRCVERTIELRPFDRALALASRSFIALLPLGMVATSLGPSSNSGGFAQAVVDRFGLQGEAAKQVKSFFAPPQQVRGSTTILGALVLVYSVVGFARLLGRLYEGAWRLPPSGLKGAVRGLGWVAATAAYVAFILPLRNGIEDHTGPFLGRIAIVITSCAVWWLTPYILLGGRVSRRSLVPTAVLTTLCMGIAGVVSGVYMPRSIGNSGAHYGPVGVAFALVSWLIAISLVVLVCASVGAVAGERWFSPERNAAEVAPGAGTATVAGP
jgi:membrane protein